MSSAFMMPTAQIEPTSDLTGLESRRTVSRPLGRSPVSGTPLNQIARRVLTYAVFAGCRRAPSKVGCCPLWTFAKSTGFEDGALLAVSLGEDADTTGAVYGQLAGAYYGVHSIPERWRSKLAKLDVVESFAQRLHEAADSFA